jgi:hypothetical protein
VPLLLRELRLPVLNQLPQKQQICDIFRAMVQKAERGQMESLKLDGGKRLVIRT